MKLNIISFIIFIFTNQQAIAEINTNLEYLSTKTQYNYFALPNNGQNNRFDIDNETETNNLRLFIEKKYVDWSFTFLIAPLKVDYTQKSKKSFLFNNTNFLKDRTTNVSYKFNSYRAGVRRFFKNNHGNKIYYGALLKIRDAELCVSQSNITDCYDNLGPVPLLNFGFELNSSTIYTKFNIDGLFSSKGSAYDVNTEVGLSLSSFKFGIGYRMLGGGADNEKLINFAQFRSLYLSLIF